MSKERPDFLNPQAVDSATGTQSAHRSEAIVLAAFGTTVEPALQSLLAIKLAMENACPLVPVRLAFTSNQIRRIWHRRAADPAYAAAHPEIPVEILHVQGILATIANLQDCGFDCLVVQSVHMVPAEEFHDVAAYVRALSSIRTMKPRWQPFRKITLGRPALGAYDLRHGYAEDIRLAAEALAEDAEQARSLDAALVYMGHGNQHFPAGGLYLEFAARMRQVYPEVLTLIGTVEGFPSLGDIEESLRQHGVRRVMLKPLLVVAGEHATRDLTGPESDSWQSILMRQGYEVFPVLRGLGEQPAFARLFINHALEAAADAGMELH